MLRLIRAERDGIGVRALSESTGMHENTIRFHLRRLLEDGVVERRPVPAGVPGRPPLLFVATHGLGHEGPANYALIAQVLTQGLAERGADAVEAATEFGRQWGRSRGELAQKADAASGTDVTDGRGGTGGAGGTSREQALATVLRVLAETGFEPDVVGPAVGAGESGEAVVQVHNCPFRLLAEEDQAVPCGVHRGIMEGVLEGVGVGGGAVTELEPFVTPHLCLARVSFPA